MSFENRSRVKFFKWTDKRPVYMFTTSKNHMCAIIQGKNEELKPDDFFYSNAKKGDDLSYQMISYYSCLRKTVKWYKKIIIQLIWGTCLIILWYIYQRRCNKDINILQFREKKLLFIFDQLSLHCRNGY